MSPTLEAVYVGLSQVSRDTEATERQGVSGAPFTRVWRSSMAATL